MARPKTVSDADVLAAAARVIGRRGNTGFTLREVGAEAGLSAATLVQRFGTKRGLLIALARAAADRTDPWFEEVRRFEPRPLDALVAALTQSAGEHTKGGDPANHLAFLHLDLRDDEMRRHARDHFAALRANIEALLEEAIEADALEEVDVPAVARTIEALYHGALLVWSVDPAQSPGAVLRKSLGLLLGPRT